MINFIAWIVLGAVAGWVASLIMGTGSQQGCLTDIIVGIVGAFIGGFIFNFFGAAGATGFNIWSFIVAVVGAVILLAVVKAVRR